MRAFFCLLTVRHITPQVSKLLTKTVGTADKDALKLEAQAVFSVDNLLAKAEAARVRREKAGISDSVEARQPREAPAFDVNLVGKYLYVLWPYQESGNTTKIWASGQVKRVADGLTDKASPRARIILPAGAVLWAWDADPEFDEVAGEKWIILKPNLWNRHVCYAWRFDPCELVQSCDGKRAPREPRIDCYESCYDSEEEYVPSDPEM